MVGSRVYVGGLPHGVRERDLERFFKGYGRTRDILIKNGYGFVEFEDYRDADDAVYELNGKDILGERVTVEPARGTARGGGSRRDHDRYDRYDRRGGGGGRYDKSNSRNSSRYGPPLRTEYRLTVENLSSRVSWQDLKDYMRQAGEVTYADAHKQRKNEGVVEFATSSDMRTAIEKLDDTELNGRRIRLVEERSTRNGRNGRGRSRSSSSRSRSRSRRRSRSRSRRSSRSRSKSKNGSKSPQKSRSRSLKRDSKSKSRSRSVKRDESRSRSRSKSERRSHSRSKSKDNKSRSRSRSPRSQSRSRSRSRSHSPQDKRDKSRSASPKNNDHSPDRGNESNED
ncbi:serine-arginine protein 55 isoform X2 [Aedes albopictus]|uniref:Putative arginine/serine-rich splicing factor n=1 Tax=Aedes albopictus TaxID=7160 RepID=A0A023EQ46_AEDAL|nr:serine-arginine protein 55-like isoform X2 [Aedes albopictus]XP_029723317.1 serine-arginine protein 55 isoform X2 [Aedes albopictus]